MSFIGELLSFNFNVPLIPIYKKIVNGKCGYEFTQVPDIAKYSGRKHIIETFSGLICSVLHTKPLAVGKFLQMTDGENYRFSMYCSAKNSYVVSFQTLKIPEGIIDNSSNI
jgi:hypothetical protein